MFPVRTEDLAYVVGRGVVHRSQLTDAERVLIAAFDAVQARAQTLVMYEQGAQRRLQGVDAAFQRSPSFVGIHGLMVHREGA